MFRRIALLIALAVPPCAHAQESDPVKFFRLDFVVREVDGGKVVNSRSYSTQTSTTRNGQNASIRTGSKVPVATGTPGTISPNQYTYMDLGVNIDCNRARLEDGQLSLFVIADITSILHEVPSATPNAIVQPTIRTNKWTGEGLIPLRKPVVLFSSDDLTTKRQMQLELTATQIK